MRACLLSGLGEAGYAGPVRDTGTSVKSLRLCCSCSDFCGGYLRALRMVAGQTPLSAAHFVKARKTALFVHVAPALAIAGILIAQHCPPYRRLYGPAARPRSAGESVL